MQGQLVSKMHPNLLPALSGFVPARPLGEQLSGVKRNSRRAAATSLQENIGLPVGVMPLSVPSMDPKGVRLAATMKMPLGNTAVIFAVRFLFR